MLNLIFSVSFRTVYTLFIHLLSKRPIFNHSEFTHFNKQVNNIYGLLQNYMYIWLKRCMFNTKTFQKDFTFYFLFYFEIYQFNLGYIIFLCTLMLIILSIFFMFLLLLFYLFHLDSNYYYVISIFYFSSLSFIFN